MKMGEGNKSDWNSDQSSIAYLDKDGPTRHGLLVPTRKPQAANLNLNDWEPYIDCLGMIVSLLVH